MTLKPFSAETLDAEISRLPDIEKIHPLIKTNQMNRQVHNDSDLWIEIESAIQEKEIIHLREQIQSISSTAGSDFKTKTPTSFTLADHIDLDDFLAGWQEVTSDSISALEPLPKIHAHHHKRASSETTHQLYREQMKSSRADQELSDDWENDPDWITLGEAIGEKDIMNLRESLRQISSSVVSHNYSTEDIERYLEGEMSKEELALFDEELAVNPQLSRDIEMHVEVEEAVAESDIIMMRESLQHIMHRQSSISRELEEIDAFLDNEMNDDDMASFMEEMENDKNLRSEVNFVRELNASLGEKDILHLRNELEQISRESYRLEQKAILPVRKISRKVRLGGVAAAVLILLLGVTPVLRFVSNDARPVYEQYYEQPASLSPSRSADADEARALMNKGNELYGKGDYNMALQVFRQILDKKADLPAALFFSGASHQGLTQYSNAIDNYNKVIELNNNLFVEQAEWYRALCYVGLDDRKNASLGLLAIVEKKGFYKEKAQRVLSLLNKEKE